MSKRARFDVHYGSKGVGAVICGGHAQVNAMSDNRSIYNNGGITRGREMQRTKLSKISLAHRPGQLAYLVNSTWWKQLQAYLNGVREMQPDTIRNQVLLDPAALNGELVELSGGPVLRTDLELTEVEVLTAAQWKSICQWYSYDEAIPRQVMDVLQASEFRSQASQTAVLGGRSRDVEIHPLRILIRLAYRARNGELICCKQLLKCTVSSFATVYELKQLVWQTSERVAWKQGLTNTKEEHREDSGILQVYTTIHGAISSAISEEDGEDTVGSRFISGELVQVVYDWNMHDQHVADTMLDQDNNMDVSIDGSEQQQNTQKSNGSIGPEKVVQTKEPLRVSVAKANRVISSGENEEGTYEPVISPVCSVSSSASIVKRSRSLSLCDDSNASYDVDAHIRSLSPISASTLKKQRKNKDSGVVVPGLAGLSASIANYSTKNRSTDTNGVSVLSESFIGPALPPPEMNTATAKRKPEVDIDVDLSMDMAHDEIQHEDENDNRVIVKFNNKNNNNNYNDHFYNNNKYNSYSYGSNKYNNNYTSYTPGECGLQNLGNTCFMSSALQCLSNTGPLRDYFASGTYRNDLNLSNPLGAGGAVANAFGVLMNDMWSGRNPSVAPAELKHQIARIADQFAGCRQHDSHELLAFLLDALHEDVNLVVNKPYVAKKESQGGQDADKIAELSWQDHKARNRSTLVDIFHGQLSSQVRCDKCDHVSITFDPFSSLSIPLESEQSVTVVAYIRVTDESMRRRLDALSKVIFKNTVLPSPGISQSSSSSFSRLPTPDVTSKQGVYRAFAEYEEDELQQKLPESKEPSAKRSVYIVCVELPSGSKIRDLLNALVTLGVVTSREHLWSWISFKMDPYYVSAIYNPDTTNIAEIVNDKYLWIQQLFPENVVIRDALLANKDSNIGQIMGSNGYNDGRNGVTELNGAANGNLIHPPESRVIAQWKNQFLKTDAEDGGGVGPSTYLHTADNREMCTTELLMMHGLLPIWMSMGTDHGSMMMQGLQPMIVPIVLGVTTEQDVHDMIEARLLRTFRQDTSIAEITLSHGNQLPEAAANMACNAMRGFSTDIFSTDDTGATPIATIPTKSSWPLGFGLLWLAEKSRLERRAVLSTGFATANNTSSNNSTSNNTIVSPSSDDAVSTVSGVVSSIVTAIAGAVSASVTRSTVTGTSEEDNGYVMVDRMNGVVQEEDEEKQQQQQVEGVSVKHFEEDEDEILKDTFYGSAMLLGSSRTSHGSNDGQRLIDWPRVSAEASKEEYNDSSGSDDDDTGPRRSSELVRCVIYFDAFYDLKKSKKDEEEENEKRARKKEEEKNEKIAARTNVRDTGGAEVNGLDDVMETQEYEIDVDEETVDEDLRPPLTWRRVATACTARFHSKYERLSTNDIRDTIRNTYEPLRFHGRNTTLSLDDCMSIFTHEERLSGDDMWYCSECKAHRRAYKKLSISRLPQFLVMHLKRFRHQAGYSRRKLEALVDFPLDGLNLDKFMRKFNNKNKVATAFTQNKPNGSFDRNDYTVAGIDTCGIVGSDTDHTDSNNDCNGTIGEASGNGCIATNGSAANNNGQNGSGGAGANVAGVGSSNHADASTGIVNGPTSVLSQSSLPPAMQQGQTTYDLYAVVNHMGSMGGGHYTAYAKLAPLESSRNRCGQEGEAEEEQVKSGWFEFDDRTVVPLSNRRKVVSPDAYLLFYKRRQITAGEKKTK